MTDDTFESDVLTILKDRPMLAAHVRDALDPDLTVHHVACRLRWMRADNKIDSKLSSRSTVWGLPGAFDEVQAPDTPETPDLAPQTPSERPATRIVYADVTHAVYSSATSRQIPITLPMEPWAAEAQG